MNSITLSAFVAALTLALTEQAHPQPVFVDAPSLIEVSEEIQTARVEQPPVIAYAGNGKWVAAWVGEKNLERDSRYSRYSAIYYSLFEPPCNRWSEWRRVYSGADEDILGGSLQSLELEVQKYGWVIGFSERSYREVLGKQLEYERLLCQTSTNSGWNWQPVQVLMDYVPGDINYLRSTALATNSDGETLSVWSSGKWGHGLQSELIDFVPERNPDGCAILRTLGFGNWRRPKLVEHNGVWILTCAQSLPLVEFASNVTVDGYVRDNLMWYLRSDDAGSTWAPVRVEATDYSSQSALVIPGVGGHWLSIEYLEGGDTPFEVYHSWDDGRSWEARGEIGVYVYDITFTADPSVATDGNGRFMLTFSGSQSGAQEKLFYLYSEDDGLSWSAPYQLCVTGVSALTDTLAVTTRRADVFCDELRPGYSYTASTSAIATDGQGEWSIAFAIEESAVEEVPDGIYTARLHFGDSVGAIVDETMKAGCEDPSDYLPPSNNVLACSPATNEDDSYGDLFVILSVLFVVLVLREYESRRMRSLD